MENLIARVCREKGRTRTELAILFECDRSLIANTEVGSPKRLSKKLLKGLSELGYDPTEMAAAYEAYRAYLKADIQAKMMATV